ncbi:histidine phosphatase family protein, partial [Onishia niordana]
MKIYFVRHGKTQWNLEKRLQGQKGDSPLLPESYEAIARVNERLGQIVQFD